MLWQRSPAARVLGLAVCGAQPAAARQSHMMVETAERLQRHLDAVSLTSSPCIELISGSAVHTTGLAVLDSSFNPPTRAHMHILTHAAKKFGLTHSLLLLAKQNADKPVVGASLLERLEMMEAIADAAEPAGSMLCGVTAHPLFVDKAIALQALCKRGTRIVVLVGFDTWIRITDAKYYSSERGLDTALRSIFEAVEVVVASRDASSVVDLAPLSADEQATIVHSLPEEVTQQRLHFIHNPLEVAGLSSSAARKAFAAGDGIGAHGMLPDCILPLVKARGMYKNELDPNNSS